MANNIPAFSAAIRSYVDKATRHRNILLKLGLDTDIEEREELLQELEEIQAHLTTTGGEGHDPDDMNVKSEFHFAFR